MANQVGINSTLESLRQSYNDSVTEIDEIRSNVASISQEQQNRVYVKSITITEDSIVVTKGDDTVETLEVPGKIDPTAIVVGIKGDAETTYRTGNVNITPANIGAANANHTHNYAGSESAGGAANSALTATKATQDSAGQIINSTYIKGISISGTTVTITKGDGTTSTLTTQDTNTTYSDMAGSTASAAGTTGLVPAPAAGAANRYLRSDGTWAVPPDTNTTYDTVSSSANGLATPSLLSTANNAVPKSGATMTGALVGQANANYTTAQFRNVTMSTSAPSGGSNGQIHFQYT